MAGVRVELLVVVVLTGTLLLVSVEGWKLLIEAQRRHFYESGQWAEPQSLTSPDDNNDYYYGGEDAVPEDAIPQDEGAATSENFSPFANHGFQVDPVDFGQRNWASGTESGFQVQLLDAPPRSHTSLSSNKLDVVCSDVGFQITLTGPLSEVKVLGSKDLSVIDAPESCGYEVNYVKNTLTVPFTGCNVKNTDGYSLQLSYVDKFAQTQFATASCEKNPESDLGLIPRSSGQPKPPSKCSNPNTANLDEPMGEQVISGQPKPPSKCQKPTTATPTPSEPQNLDEPMGEQVTSGQPKPPSKCQKPTTATPTPSEPQNLDEPMGEQVTSGQPKPPSKCQKPTTATPSEPQNLDEPMGEQVTSGQPKPPSKCQKQTTATPSEPQNLDEPMGEQVTSGQPKPPSKCQKPTTATPSEPQNLDEPMGEQVTSGQPKPPSKCQKPTTATPSEPQNLDEPMGEQVTSGQPKPPSKCQKQTTATPSEPQNLDEPMGEQVTSGQPKPPSKCQKPTTATPSEPQNLDEPMGEQVTSGQPKPPSKCQKQTTATPSEPQNLDEPMGEQVTSGQPKPPSKCQKQTTATPSEPQDLDEPMGDQVTSGQPKPQSQYSNTTTALSTLSEPQNCGVPMGEQVNCGQSGISSSDCRMMGCCVDSATSACYYPLDECTGDQHFVFAIRSNSASIPVDPTKLVIPGSTNCKPVLVNNKVAIFKFKLTECGVHAYEVGEMMIYLAEVQSVAQALNLKFGIITRSDPLRFMIECRYSKTGSVQQSMASVGYLVKTPSSSLPSVVISNGLYGVQLRIATDQSYSSYFPTHHQPLRLLLGNPVYLELHLKSPKPDAVILVNYCIAYPRSAKNALVLIYEGCANPNDPKVSILKVSDLPKNRHQRRFVVSAFQFMDQRTNKYLDEEIYFMCSTEVCYELEKTCEQQCFDGKAPQGFAAED